MKKLKVSLLTKVVIAIAAGVLFGQFLPNGIARIFVTFNSLFGNFLSFSIPLIILGLVTPAIGDLGKGAGKLLAITALIAYGSTIFQDSSRSSVLRRSSRIYYQPMRNSQPWIIRKISCCSLISPWVCLH